MRLAVGLEPAGFGSADEEFRASHAPHGGVAVEIAEEETRREQRPAERAYAADGRVFINAMGCGYDAEIAQRFASSTRRGFLTYAQLCLSALRDLHTQRVEIEAGASRFALDALLVTVANSPQYGNEAEVAPGAQVDDGRLDLVAVSGVGPIGGALLAARLFLGNFDRHRAVRWVAGSEFVIRRAEAGWLHVDGEPHVAGRELRVAIRPQSLQLLVPAR